MYLYKTKLVLKRFLSNNALKWSRSYFTLASQIGLDELSRPIYIGRLPSPFPPTREIVGFPILQTNRFPSTCPSWLDPGTSLFCRCDKMSSFICDKMPSSKSSATYLGLRRARRSCSRRRAQPAPPPLSSASLSSLSHITRLFRKARKAFTETLGDKVLPRKFWLVHYSPKEIIYFIKVIHFLEILVQLKSHASLSTWYIPK